MQVHNIKAKVSLERSRPNTQTPFKIKRGSEIGRKIPSRKNKPVYRRHPSRKETAWRNTTATFTKIHLLLLYSGLISLKLQVRSVNSKQTLV